MNNDKTKSHERKPVGFSDAAGDNTTVYISARDFLIPKQAAAPAIVIQQEGCVEMIPLKGEQLLGRPAANSAPDIALNSPFVSRRHGFFSIEGAHVYYTALKSTNGTYFKGYRLAEMERAELRDGDILQIYSGTGDHSDITLNCAFSYESQNNWNRVIANQLDPLTGLMNRKLFTGWFANNQRLGEGENAYVFLLDVDHFKQINDVFGHEYGDLALTALAGVLKEHVSPLGKAARWGGDEFVGLLRGDREAAAACFEAIRDALSRKRIHDLFTVNISAGLSPLAGNEDDSLLKLLSAADKALYEAKKRGRNQIVFSDEES